MSSLLEKLSFSEELSLASLELLTHPQQDNKGIEASQLNSSKEGDVCDLVWPNIDQDRRIFTSVLDLLSMANCFKDEVFKRDFLPIIKHLLSNTQLFQFLADPEIILTKAHQENGLNSAEHIFKVLDELPTKHLDNKHKLILRIFAIHHDLGKAISAGLNREEIEQALSHPAYQDIKDDQGNLKNSFPDHQLNSALLFLSLYEGRSNQLDNHNIGEKEIKLIAYLIANHHSLYHFRLSPDHEQFQNWREVLPGNLAQQELLLAYLFIFNYADTSATPAHQKWLKPNLIWMENLLTDLTTLPPDLHNQIQDTILKGIVENKLDVKS